MSDLEIQVDVTLTQIATFCHRWQIIEFALFGSVLHEDFHPESDVDVLVTFAPGSKQSLSDLIQMQEEIEGIFGRKVALINRKNIEKSRNYLRRNAILKSARTIYVA
jgi:predicted nucleotidyltransferase